MMRFILNGKHYLTRSGAIYGPDGCNCFKKDTVGGVNLSRCVEN